MPSSRAAFNLSADLRVIPPVTAATMPLLALSALWRSVLAIGEDGSVPPLHLALGASHGCGVGVGGLLQLLQLLLLLLLLLLGLGVNIGVGSGSDDGDGHSSSFESGHYCYSLILSVAMDAL